MCLLVLWSPLHSGNPFELSKGWGGGGVPRVLGNLVVLNFHPQFVAKNSIDFESYAYIFRVEFLSDFMGHEQEERGLFPVRVLRCYLLKLKRLFQGLNPYSCPFFGPTRSLLKNA